MTVAVFDTKPYDREYLAHVTTANLAAAVSHAWLDGTLLT